LLLKWRTILDNVLLPAEIVGLPIKAARTRARDLLQMVGLAGHETNIRYATVRRHAAARRHSARALCTIPS
jgi:ABC-type nitrate/sulfonate/bicarbonate transport system ATPase subunit